MTDLGSFGLRLGDAHQNSHTIGMETLHCNSTSATMLLLYHSSMSSNSVLVGGVVPMVVTEFAIQYLLLLRQSEVGGQVEGQGRQTGILCLL